MKTFKEWFRLREGLWHTKGDPSEKRAGAKHPYNKTFVGQGGGGTGVPITPAGGQMSKRMKKKMKDN